MYDERQIDHDAVFMHSATEAQFLREGRMEFRQVGDYPRVPFFKADDAEYPDVRVGVHDKLERGVVFKRQSPPPLSADDLRFVYGEHDEKAGASSVTLHCDKANRASIFIVGQLSEERMIQSFLRSYHEHLTEYTPVRQKAPVA